jgi:glycosyltransferase involved in cell wall biosynthesis
LPEDQQPRISIVIATLGGPWIAGTINSLLNGSLPPCEILICIPDDFATNVSHLANDIVKIVSTEVKGQVRQRAVGFSKCSQPIVLQLDDDILIEKNTLQDLVAYILQLGKGNVIAPVYYGKNTHTCIHKMLTGFAGFKKNLFDTVVCAAPWGKKKMGIVTSIGINYGIDDSAVDRDLVLQDFFPFEGKAYCEDVFHSFYRALAHTKMWVAINVKVYIDEPIPEFGKTAVEKVIRIRKKYLSLINRPGWRLFFYEFFCRMRSKVNGKN